MKHFLDLLLYPVRVAVTPLYFDPLTVLAAAGNLVKDAAPSVIGNLINYKSNKETNAANISAQKDINAQNLAFQREQFDYQKYLNENQYQMTASDMQKAGLNPMLMNGANLTSGSYQSNAQAPQANPYQLDVTSLVSAINESANRRNQKDIASDSNQTSKDVANINASSQEEIARQNRKVQESIAQGRLKLDENIAKAESARKDAVTRAEIERLRRGYDTNFGQRIKNDKDLYDLYTSLRTRNADSNSSPYSAFWRSMQEIATKLGRNPDIRDMSFDEFSELYYMLYDDKYDYSFNPHTW